MIKTRNPSSKLLLLIYSEINLAIFTMSNKNVLNLPFKSNLKLYGTEAAM